MKRIILTIMLIALCWASGGRFNLVEAQTAVGIYVDVPTKGEIIDFAKEHPVFYGTNEQLQDKYLQKPSLNAPYYEGRLKQEVLQDGLNATNIMRYIAGLPAEITLNSQYNEYAQAASLVNRVNDTLTHYPTRPQGINEELYQKAVKGAKSSNIAMGYSSLSHSVIGGYMEDGDYSNIDRVGHRRWILNPPMKQVGFGLVDRYSAMYVFDNSFGNFDSKYNVVTWPAQNMPVEYFTPDYPFSLSLSREFDIQHNVAVKMKKKSNDQTWYFSMDSDQKDGYFNVDRGGYGQPNCIIWRPNYTRKYRDGDVFEIEIEGVSKGGEAYPIKYEVSFFTLKQNFNTTATIPSFEVTINGTSIDNQHNLYPMLVHKDITYIPMTWDNCQALGLDLQFDENGLSINQINSSSPVKQDLTGNNDLSKIYEVVKPSYKIKVNGKVIDNLDEEYPILNFRGITYFPLTWRFAVEEFGWQTKFDAEKGFTISSIRAIEVPVQGIKLNQKQLMLESEQNDQLQATIEPFNAYNQEVIWEVKDTSVAQVDTNGNVKAIAPGKTIVTVTTVDGGYSDSCEVIVKDLSQKVEVIIPKYEVQLNGVTIDNCRNKYPMISYKDITYVPMTWNYTQALGLSLEFDSDNGLKIAQSGTHTTLEQDLGANNDLNAVYQAVIPTYDIYVNGRWVDNLDEEYPIINFRDITYFPLTWDFAVTEFGWSLNFDENKGFIINSSQFFDNIEVPEMES